MPAYLDSPEVIRRIDRSGMLNLVGHLADQCRDGFRRGFSFEVPSAYRSLDRLLIAGMGGSAIGGDLVNGFLEGLKGARSSRPLLVSRSYAIPSWVDRQTGVLLSSYSGNTEETLCAGRQALERKAKLLAVTSGGKLAAWADRAGFPLLTIPPGFPPRAAIGYMGFAPLGILVRLGWVYPTIPVEGACRSVEEFIDFKLNPSVPTALNPAKRIAWALKGRLPVLYGSSGGWEGLTYRWRTQLEENAKSLSFHHLFPEATHNELSGWVEPRSLLKKMTAIFLKDPAVHPKVLRRMTFTEGVIRRQGSRVLVASVSGPSLLSRMLKLLALGDFVSVYLALLYRVDPTPVERVEALKKYMES